MNGFRPAAVVALLLVVFACGGGDGPSSGSPNLLLITLDTTRPDVLGCYGGDVETPVLDRLAAEGVRFDNAWTVTPLTLPSHASILTGLLPPSHGIRENTNHCLAPGVKTLAEHLAEHGYRTGAVVSSIVLSKMFGLDQGFQFWDEPRSGEAIRAGGAGVEFREILERKAGDTTDRVLQHLDGSDQGPFFQWVHYYDPHASYDPPEPFASRYRDDPYAGEVAYVDSEIGRLLSALENRGLLADTLVVVLSDHGESLGEHGENTHGLFIYRSTIQVPLILRFPGRLPAGSVRSDPVSVVDLVPMMLEIMKVAPMSLPDKQPYIYAESELPLRSYGWAPLYSLHDGRWRFIAAPTPELYDMKADADETTNLAGANLDELMDWRRKLAAMMDSLPATPAGDRPDLDDESIQQLMSLGYLSGPGSTREPGAGHADPKERVGLHNELIRAGALLAAGDLQNAGRAAAEVLEVDPENPGALELAGVLTVSSDPAQGIAALRRAVEKAPGSWEIRRNLANALHIAGDLAGAAREYRAALELQPGVPATWFGLGNVLFAAGDLEQAEPAYRRGLELDPDQPAVQAALGTTLGRKGDLAGGRVLLEAALARDPSMADAWNQLGILKEKGGELAAAQADYLKALDARPDHADALFNAAKVSLRMGEVREAREWLDRLKRAHPAYPLTPVLEQRLAAE